MKVSLPAILDGRPAVAYGAGEYFGRFCDRGAEAFEYFVDDALAGQTRNGLPVRAVADLANENRDVCVFLFVRDVGPALLRLDEFGLRWGENVFDARVFGDGSHLYDDYHLLRTTEEIAESPHVEWQPGHGAEWKGGRVLVRRRAGAKIPGIFLAEDARLETADIVLSSDSRICVGRKGAISLGGMVSLPEHLLLNCSLGSTLRVGPGTVFSPHTVVNTASHTSITIGGGVTFGPHLDLYAYAPIAIGDGCMFSSHVFMASGAGHDLIVDSGAKPPREIRLGERVWIGWGAQVLAGAELGAGSMAASASVVNRGFPPGSLVAGVPAKIIASDISWDRDYLAYKRLFHPAFADGQP